MTGWGLGHCFCPEQVQLAVGLEVKIAFFFFVSERFTIMYFDLLSPNLWFSPQSISGTRAVLFQLLEKSWKYFCLVRWISRLYSLQCSPFILRVPFLRLLLAHAFYLCQENMKLNVFWPSHSTVCPWRVHCHIEKSQRNTAQFSARKCCRS